MDLRKLPPEARTYVVLRDAGVDHGTALLKVARGNWNPYTGSPPTVTDEQLRELEDRLVAAEVYTRKAV
jgi:hypothetical protein